MLRRHSDASGHSFIRDMIPPSSSVAARIMVFAAVTEGTMASFETIRMRAAERKGGTAALAGLLGPVADNASVAGLSDDRILSAMAQRIFAAGFVWSVIERKWPGFEEAFLGFEPKRLVFQPDDFWHELAGDQRIVRNPKNIRAVRDNAGFVARLSAEHGGFGRFLAQWPADDQIGLTAFLAKHGSRLGGNSAPYFLRMIGWDSFLLTTHVVAALRDAGLDIAAVPASRRDLAKVQWQLNEWRHETGLSYAHLSRILAFSIGENRAAEGMRH